MLVSKVQFQTFQGIRPKNHNAVSKPKTEQCKTPCKENKIYYTRPYILSVGSDNLLKDIQTKEELVETLKDKEKSFDFFNKILSDPRNSKKITRELRSIAGGIDAFTKLYYAKDGYKDAYSNYAKNIYENAKTPDDLLKLSPNWTCWAIKEKFGKDYTIGEVPEEIGSQEEYRELVQSILKDKPEDIKELGGGLSGKRAFLLTYGDKKYVLKVQNDYLIYSDALKKALEEDPWLEDSFFENYKDNESMKPDSCFLNATMDRYLNLHGCKNAPTMCFYDSKTSSVLYEFTEGDEYEGELNLLNINDTLKDLTGLGIIYNDVCYDNLRVQKDNSIKIIDSGNSGFIDILKPTVIGLQFELPDWSGNGITSFRAGMYDIK